MDEPKFSFSGSFQKTKEYIDTQLEILKLKAISKISRIVGAIILDITKLVLTLVIIFFLSLALGFWLGELLNSNALGFLVTGAIFIIILVIVMLLEPKLEAKFMDITIKKVLGKWNEEEGFISRWKVKNLRIESKPRKSKKKPMLP
ncbi:phage holin family protein [Sphingobacterium sp. T2]|uniref:phage holin family protein n=1 Tax=Sphingobacterium sp. T2 TaxID=1590596 RepID=UPI0009E54528|nr:phage holin family protein [Sphingobacterium sp. T2]